jgi:hypothetical protein
MTVRTASIPETVRAGAVMDEEEKLLYGLFLNSGVRDAEMQNTEYADFNWEKCTLHVQPKAWRKFRLKGF